MTMMKLRSVTAGAIATAMLATSVTPAMAQGYPGGGFSGGYGGGYGRPTYGYPGGHGGYRRHRDHDNTGAVVAGVIGVGILAAIIASASSSKNRTNNGGYATNGYTGNIRTDDAAADACASAAEQQLGGSARVSGIDTVNRVSDGYNVRGTVDYGRSNGNDRYRGGYDQRSFSCSVRYGSVSRVDFGG
jgi:hypothetical protein